MQIGELLLEATRQLKAAGVDAPRLGAVLLLAEATGLSADRIRIDLDRAVAGEAEAAFRTMLARRLRREPISHILGRREFWGLEFCVTADVLDPRPDSETLIAAVLERIAERSAALRIVDFGTGSGCLLLALLHELPAAAGLGIDRSAAALAIAEANAARLGLSARARFRQGDWGAGLDGRFDILIANPPYIETAAIDGLEPEVAHHEPRLALDGGADGMAAYRRLIPDLARLAAPNAAVALEVGQGQDVAVAGLLEAAGFGEIAVKADLAGIGRAVLARQAN
ncbi:MAG TPA: peptide chain release factor N(5)-glutamine methyltransferase [Ferrovibrio sp.]|uniref:peptide chain release factor N(5)-glutamine methyltransferase n=1 Tax=Ferrovibrio sp. TaxID=1917215 RepID=UPI002ED56329